MNRVFRKTALENVFQRDGIVQLPFTGEAMCRQLSEMFLMITGAESMGQFHSTMFHSNPAYRKTVSEELSALLKLPAEEYLEGYRILFANFICKEGGGNNAVGLHQDWSMTDEKEFSAVNIWIPLTDINPERGAFRAMKGSHRICRNIRYTPYPTHVYRDAEMLIGDELDAFYPKAGEALIYDAALLHASDANVHRDMRLAVGMALVPVAAKSMHYFRPDSEVKKLEVFLTGNSHYDRITLEGRPENSPDSTLETFDDFSDMYQSLSQWKQRPERKVFKDAALNRELKDSGFVLLRGVLGQAELDELKTVYLRNKPETSEAFAISNWTQSENYRESSQEVIGRVAGKLASEYLDSYRSVMGVFAVKQSGKGSAMLMHQDWSLVDERKFTSVSFWCPLQATNFQNGNLQIVIGSHRDLGGVRGVNVPPPFDEEGEKELRSFRLLDLPMEEGDVVVFDHRLIHCSPDNLSGKERVSAVLALVPEEAGLVHYYQIPESNGSIEMLALDPETFYRINFFDHPNRPEYLCKSGYYKYKV